MPNADTNIGPEAAVSLREITRETLWSILNLSVTKEQEKFVASNAVSIAEAHFAPEAWFRAIYADETPVGFLMLSEKPANGDYFLWRFMIDAKHQGKGYGRRAIELLIGYVRTRPKAKELLLSHVAGDGSPEDFYRKLGFEHTGDKSHFPHPRKGVRCCGQMPQKLRATQSAIEMEMKAINTIR